MEEYKGISDVCKELQEETGVYVAPDRIRSYEKAQLISSTRDKNNDYRLFSEDEQARLRKVMMLVEIGVSFEDILKDNTDVIDRRIKSIAYIVDQLKRMRKEV